MLKINQNEIVSLQSEIVTHVIKNQQLHKSKGFFSSKKV